MFRGQLRMTIVAFILLAWASSIPTVSAQKDAKKDDLSDMVVEIEGMKSEAPKTWKREKPANTFRTYQFALPKVEGDKEDAELFVSNQVIGKKEEDILGRWKKMFLPPEGKNVDDISKVSKIKMGDFNAAYLEVEGVYLHKKVPIDPDYKAVKKPDYRMIRVLLQTKDDSYYISLIGPAKTVEAHKKAFDEWLKAF